jgi:hypothetical protein
MLKNIRKGMFPFLIGFSALSVSASAAFYSVSGLSKLFAGASLEVIIMAGSLEFAKLVTASLLYQYWDTINKTLRTYLTIATIILVLITSMGIYGFLSAAYQETYTKLTAVENEKKFIQQKIDFYDADVTRYDEELKRISSNISTLSNARSQQIQVRDTSVVGGVRTTISTSELRLAQSRIEVEEDNRNAVQAKREVAADSLQTLKLKILEIQNEADTVGELGPLQYLSGLTGAPMDKIINILLLVIIFVFDPLAISMVIAANFAFDKANPKRREDEETPYEPTLTDDFDEEEDEDDYYDNRGSVYYDDDYDESDWKDGIADQSAYSKPPFDVSIDREAAQGWYDIADEIAKESTKLPDEARGFAPPELDEDQILEEEFGHLADEGLDDLPWEQDPEVQAFLEAQDEPGPWSEEDDKIHTIGGLTNDKESGFMDFQKKMDKNDKEWDEEHALDQVLNDMVESLDEEDLKELEINDPEEVSNKTEVENTQGDVTIVDNSDKTETEADRIGTFPNENNPFSVAAQVKSIVEKVETPHLPTEEATTQATTLPTTTQAPTTQATTTLAPPPSYDSFKKREAVDEDELFDAALRAKAEQDKQDFLRRNG